MNIPKHAYAIVRVDEFLKPDTPMEHKITVKKIVWSMQIALNEVKRLNELKKGKMSYYFWQYTRIDPNIVSDVVE
jgi:hypothetical protein